MASTVVRDRFRACLLGQAVGDGLGAPFEGLPPDFVYWTIGPMHEVIHRPIEGGLGYTDDTEMMIGVAEELIQHGEIRPESLARRFAANYTEERGYGPGARRILEGMAAGGDWDELARNVFPGGSFGNGAAMRAAPIGLAFAHDPDRLVDQAELSALPTHRHPLGVEGAVLFAAAVALASAGPPLDRREFYRSLKRHCRSEEFAWQVKAAGRLRRGDAIDFLGSSLPAHRSVVTAIACFTTARGDFTEAVTRAIGLGDDTDTLAAMAGTLCGAYTGKVPENWLDELEDGPKGRSYIEALADRLYDVTAARTA